MEWKELSSQIILSSQPTIYQCEPAWNWRNPLFVDFDLWVVLEGEGWIEVSGTEFQMGRGEAILFRPGDSVKGRHNPSRPLKVFALHFNLPPALETEMGRVIPRRLVFHDIRRCESVIMDLLADNRSKKVFVELYLATLLAQAVQDEARKFSDPVDEKLTSLCQEMDSNPSLDWEPVEMARKTGLSLPQFNRRFRAFAGTSPVRYLIQRRVDRARWLLRETCMTLQEIAEALGYTDIYYFHRQFRAETEKTPAGYRSEGTKD